MIAWQIILWASLGGLVYVFAGYPVLAKLLGRLFGRPVECGRFAGTVSVVVAGHNEAARLPGKLDSLAASSAADRILEVVVGTDGPDPELAAVLAARTDEFSRRVRLVEFSQRRGKPAVLKDLIPTCRGDVLLLTDARQHLHPAALSRLLANFADDSVQVASGELVFLPPADATTAASGVGFYWTYEKLIRKAESGFRGVPGATGAFYAVRRDAIAARVERFAADTLLDDVAIPMLATEAGGRCVFEASAIAYDRPSTTTGQETVRKRRTIAGAAQLAWRNIAWSLPGGHPLWWEFASHKVARLAGPLLLVGAMGANLALLGQGGFYRGLLAVQLACYLVAAIGYVCQTAGLRSRLASPFLMFLTLNLTTVVGVWDAMRGRFNSAWERSASSV